MDIIVNFVFFSVKICLNASSIFLSVIFLFSAKIKAQKVHLSVENPPSHVPSAVRIVEPQHGRECL